MRLEESCFPDFWKVSYVLSRNLRLKITTVLVLYLSFVKSEDCVIIIALLITLSKVAGILWSKVNYLNVVALKL